MMTASSAPAQEALQNSLMGNAASQSAAQTQPQEYTVKKGDFKLLVLPSMALQWNDNVFLSQMNAQEDVIVKPAVGITASYPFGQRNLLFLNFSIGYDEYLIHPDLSSIDLNSASQTGLSFDLGIKDVTLNFHDSVSYNQNSSQTPTVANTGSYGTFQNTAGLSATWDLNQVTLSAGYDHQNILATSSQYNQINHASEMLFARAGLQVHPQVTVGLETTAAFTTYEEAVLNDNDAYTVGPYITFQPDNSLKITARGGYSIYQFQQTSAEIQTSSQNSWYADVNITHQPWDFLSYSVDVGREVQLGTSSDLTEDWYFRPNLTLKMIKGLDINTSFSFEHGDQGVGSVGTIPGNTTGTFDWYGAGLTLSHPLTSRLNLALNYQLTIRSSATPNEAYTQNLIGLELTYHPL